MDDLENTFNISTNNESYNVMEIYDKVTVGRIEDHNYDESNLMYKIDIEIINKYCLINTKGYFQDGKFFPESA